jgi:hypothetical protein
MVVALDRSTSMNNSRVGNGTRLTVTVDAVKTLLNAYGSVIQFGYVDFPGLPPDGSCSSAVGCCAGTVIAPARTGQSNKIMTISRQLDECPNSPQCINTDQTPTAQVLSRIGSALPSGLLGFWYTLLVTDGEPSCASGQSSKDLCDQARDEISMLDSLNVSTYVVGIGGDLTPSSGDPSVGNQCLNALALAGGTNRTTTPYYYAASNLANSDLHNALVTIANQAVCHLALANNNTQFDRDRVDLAMGSSLIPRDTSGGSGPQDAGPANGWSFDPGSTSTITVVGKACETFVSLVTNPSADFSKVHLNVCPISSH